MILINNLFGPFDAETSEGRGANAAHNVVKYINEGRKVAEVNIKKFMNGEISLEDAAKNEPIEQLATAYIPYMPIEEGTGIPDFKYGLAYASVYIKAFDRDGDGALSPQEAGPFGHVLDFIAPQNKITPGKFLAWLIFQDCIEISNGVISPKKAFMAMQLVQKDPEFVKDRLEKIYFGHGIYNYEESFTAPVEAR